MAVQGRSFVPVGPASALWAIPGLRRVVRGGCDFGASFRFVCGLLLEIPGHMVCLVLVIRFHDDLDYLHFWQQAFQNMPDMSSEKH